MMSAMVKLATGTGMPVAGYMVSSGRRRSKRHRRACLGVDGVPGVFPRQAVENNAPFPSATRRLVTW